MNLYFPWKSFYFSRGRDRKQTRLQICAQVEDILQQMAELQESLRRLCSTREAEKELNSWSQVQFAVDPEPMAQEPKTSLPAHTERGLGRGQ